MLYFAYGSNMDFAQMQERCSSTRFLCIAMLEGHKLIFPRMSESTKSEYCGSGVASVGTDDNQNVWGVVYQIDELDVGKLDKKEGYNPSRERNAYLRCEKRVLRDDAEHSPSTVSTYVGVPQNGGPFRPTSKYLDAILRGARYWRLPEQYIKALEEIKTSD